MNKYKVVERKPLEPIDIPDYAEYDCKEMSVDYGLSLHFTLDEIYFRWSNYSTSRCAGWLGPTKEGVEEAFGVILEEALK